MHTFCDARSGQVRSGQVETEKKIPDLEFEKRERVSLLKKKIEKMFELEKFVFKFNGP